MSPLRTILFAVNPRLPAMPRLLYCAELACVMNAELGMLHVVEPGSPDCWQGINAVQRQIEHSPISPFRTWSVVMPGKPAEVVASFAATVHAGLIVLTARRRRAFSRALLGSTSTSIAGRASCPVLLSNEATSEQQKGFECRRIICVVSFNGGLHDYIAYISSVARTLGATITFLYVLPELHEGRLASVAYGDDEFVVRPEDARARIAKLASELSVPYNTVIGADDPADAIRRELGVATDCIIAVKNNARGCPSLVDELAGAVPAPLLTVPFRSFRPA